MPPITIDDDDSSESYMSDDGGGDGDSYSVRSLATQEDWQTPPLTKIRGNLVTGEELTSHAAEEEALPRIPNKFVVSPVVDASPALAKRNHPTEPPKKLVFSSEESSLEEEPERKSPSGLEKASKATRTNWHCDDDSSSSSVDPSKKKSGRIPSSIELSQGGKSSSLDCRNTEESFTAAVAKKPKKTKGHHLLVQTNRRKLPTKKAQGREHSFLEKDDKKSDDEFSLSLAKEVAAAKQRSLNRVHTNRWKLSTRKSQVGGHPLEEDDRKRPARAEKQTHPAASRRDEESSDQHLLQLEDNRKCPPYAEKPKAASCEGESSDEHSFQPKDDRKCPPYTAKPTHKESSHEEESSDEHLLQQLEDNRKCPPYAAAMPIQDASSNDEESPDEPRWLPPSARRAKKQRHGPRKKKRRTLSPSRRQQQGATTSSSSGYQQSRPIDRSQSSMPNVPVPDYTAAYENLPWRGISMMSVHTADTYREYNGKIVNVDRFLETKSWPVHELLNKKTSRHGGRVEYLCRWEDTWETKGMYRALKNYKRTGYPVTVKGRKKQLSEDGYMVDLVLCRWKPGWEPEWHVNRILIDKYDARQAAAAAAAQGASNETLQTAPVVLQQQAGDPLDGGSASPSNGRRSTLEKNPQAENAVQRMEAVAAHGDSNGNNENMDEQAQGGEENSSENAPSYDDDAEPAGGGSDNDSVEEHANADENSQENVSRDDDDDNDGGGNDDNSAVSGGICPGELDEDLREDVDFYSKQLLESFGHTHEKNK